MKTWSEVSARLGRNDLPWCLSTHLDVLPQEEIAKGLADAWTMCEWPGGAGTTDIWELMFMLGGAGDNGYLDDDGNKQSYETLPKTMILYRGAHEDYVDGMSWTSDIKRAEWFAQRLGTKGMSVYTITVPRELVLAKFDRRNENEYVIEVSRLLEDDIQKLESTSVSE